MRYPIPFVLLLTFMISVLYWGCTADSTPSKQQQIETAVLAAPKNKRDSATVLGYTKSGKVDTLRTGTNNFVCLADDPNEKGFSVACYHKKLQPFMRRGRKLRAQGKSRKEVFKIRGKEVKSGKLPLPKGSTLYVLTGDYDESTGKIKNKYLRYVVYLPFATKASTGLPGKPISPGGPWLMNPGTHKAHIMVNPPRSDQ